MQGTISGLILRTCAIEIPPCRFQPETSRTANKMDGDQVHVITRILHSTGLVGREAHGVLF